MLVSFKIFTGVCINTEQLLHMLFWHKNVFTELLTSKHFSLKKKMQDLQAFSRLLIYFRSISEAWLESGAWAKLGKNACEQYI